MEDTPTKTRRTRKTADAPEGVVPMVRNAEQWPEGPWAADVHPDEVENYAAFGWVIA